MRPATFEGKLSEQVDSSQICAFHINGDTSFSDLGKENLSCASNLHGFSLHFKRRKDKKMFRRCENHT